MGLGTQPQPLLLHPLLPPTSLSPNIQKSSREGRILEGSQGWERGGTMPLQHCCLDSPRPAAADVRAEAKQHSELTGLHLASALKEVINRNNHPGAAAHPGGSRVHHHQLVLDRGMVPPSPGAAPAKADERKKLWKMREKEVPGRAWGVSLHTRHWANFSEEIK